MFLIKKYIHNTVNHVVHYENTVCEYKQIQHTKKKKISECDHFATKKQGAVRDGKTNQSDNIYLGSI